MSESKASAGSAAADLILALAEALQYISYDTKASAALLGVKPEAFKADLRDSVARKAAHQTRMVHMAERLETYAWEGTWPGDQNDLMENLAEFEVATELLNGKHGCCLIDPNHDVLVPEASRSCLLDVLTAAQTRLAIELESLINVPMLAALARVSEKTIRMASNPNNDRPLKTVKDGSATFIRSEDALEWLGRRSDFKPTRYHVSAESRPRPVTFPALAEHLRAVRTERGLTVEALSEALGWSDDTLAAYRALETAKAPVDLAALQPRHLAQVAKHLEIYEPLEFARENYRLIAGAFSEALVKEQLA